MTCPTLLMIKSKTERSSEHAQITHQLRGQVGVQAQAPRLPSHSLGVCAAAAGPPTSRAQSCWSDLPVSARACFARFSVGPRVQVPVWGAVSSPPLSRSHSLDPLPQ